MRILLTGVSSFTGCWFAAALARRGHCVTGTLQGRRSDYPELPRLRLAKCEEVGVELAEGASYGSASFLALVGRGWDAVAYHGADVRDYRTPEFNLLGALEHNTRGAAEFCRQAVANGVRRLIVSGTVFEPYAGHGDHADRAVTPYGLSKALTWEVLRFHAQQAGLPTAKFVIANPFGRYEQERFCTYLVRTWLAGETAEVRTPDYVRDNVPVDALAEAYADFAEDVGEQTCAPSGYVGRQGEFAARFAREIGTRLGIETPFTLARQIDFSEPMTRVAADPLPPSWDEQAFWDDLAAFYSERFSGRRE